MSQRRRTWGNVITNWQRHDLPLRTKLRLQLKNSWRRLVRLSNCCGNHGEPGC